MASNPLAEVNLDPQHLDYFSIHLRGIQSARHPVGGRPYI